MHIRAGLVALAATNTGPIVAPTGTARPYFGTNPLALGMPAAGEEPMVFDMATSAVAASARFSLRLNAAYWAQDQRAEHQLSVLVKNVGQEPIERYYCEVDVRHGLIDNPPTSLHFQPDRSSNEWDLFLFDEKNRPSLYPGQECVVWTTMLATDLSGPSGILARVRFKPAGASIAEGRLEWPVQDGAGV